MIVSVVHCARCEKDHTDLFFRKFGNPPPNWSHFAPCPTTDEPILLTFEEDE